jgi:hypothetical protein
MAKPKQLQTIGWQDLPREQRRRLTVLIGKLVRQRLAAAADPETGHERDDAKRGLFIADRQSPGTAS